MRLNGRACLQILATVSAIVLVIYWTDEPRYDQLWLLIRAGWPFDCGLASCAFAKATGLITSDLWWRSAIFRVIAAVVAVSGLWMGLSATSASWNFRALALAAFLGSGLYAVWVSADVLAAAGVGWLVASTRWPSFYVPAALLLAFSKPDLLIPGVLLGWMLAPSFRQWGAFMVSTAFLTACGLSSVHQMPRVVFAFWQHYAGAMHGAFDDFERYIGPFPWNTYLPYLGVAALLSLKHMAVSGVIAPMAACLLALRHRTRIATALAVFLVSHTLITAAIVFMHVRYLGRFLVAAILIMASVESSSPRWLKRIMAASLTVLIVYEVIGLPTLLLFGPSTD